jgi:hypothetical protein
MTVHMCLPMLEFTRMWVPNNLEVTIEGPENGGSIRHEKPCHGPN